MSSLARIEEIGIGVSIDPSAEFIDVENLCVGDHTYIGPGVRIVGGSFSVGEYSKIHRNCYIYPKSEIELGHGAWIGQGVHLDGTGGIRSGDFLVVGINSALYSHIRAGDVTEGCVFDKNGFLEIGHDVWFVGMCMVSPVAAKDKSVALLGSVITRDMNQNTVYGGNPAIDLTGKFGRPYVERSNEAKFEAVAEYVKKFFYTSEQSFDRDSVRVVMKASEILPGVTNYCIETRSYTKTNSETEVALNKWLFGYRAKFRPSVVAT